MKIGEKVMLAVPVEIARVSSQAGKDIFYSVKLPDQDPYPVSASDVRRPGLLGWVLWKLTPNAKLARATAPHEEAQTFEASR